VEWEFETCEEGKCIHTEPAYGIVALMGAADDPVCTVAVRERRHMATLVDMKLKVYEY